MQSKLWIEAQKPGTLLDVYHRDLGWRASTLVSVNPKVETVTVDIASLRADIEYHHVEPYGIRVPPAPAPSWKSSPVGTAAHAAAMFRSLPGKADEDMPDRFVKAMGEMLDGYGADIDKLLKTFPIDGDHGVVHVRDVPFASLCEHHALPFFGTVGVAYIPKDKIVGLSKIPRLVRALSRRYQVQERLGKQIGDALWDRLDAVGVAVMIRGRHTCMQARGVESTGEMVTSYMLGVFRAQGELGIAARAEVMSLLK